MQLPDHYGREFAVVNPTVTLTNLGSGMASGDLMNHPGRLVVHTRRVTPTELAISLWKPLSADGIERMPMGSGRLLSADGEWRGSVNELDATWFVRGKVGAGVLEFAEMDE